MAFKRGIPNMRIVYTPHPVTDRSPEISRKYLEGKDPVTGKPILEEIVDALTEPVSGEDKGTGFLPRESRPRFLDPDTEGNLERYFYENNFTDGLPIILPTEEKVAEMLKATSHRPDEVVGKMAASTPHEAWEYTVEMVAVNAVMSGAKPEYFPAILAIASTGATSLVSSTSSYARMALFNGPFDEEIGMNSGVGALGPFNRANATIGRCWTLISKNLGGSGTPGETYMGSQGTPLNYSNLCFPETEDGLPEGWIPFHAQKGFEPSESVVSIFGGWSLDNIAWFSPLPIHQVIRGWLEHFFSTVVTGATIIVDPTVAADIAAAGFDSQKAFADYLIRNTGTPGWLYWQTRREEMEQARQGIEPYASYLSLGEDNVLPISRFKGDLVIGVPVNPSVNFPRSSTPIEIIVMGGKTNTYWSGGDFSYATSASIDEWR
ncbi:MAG: hypothetical protein P8Z37_08760 [Acidobacteriota bacterium]